jgi:hypothetical protein
VGIILVWRREAGDEDLHDAGADFLGEILKRPGQIAKRGGLSRGPLGVCGRWRQEKDRDQCDRSEHLLDRLAG